MTLKRINYNIRKAESPKYKILKNVARTILHFNVPAFRPFYVPLYRFHELFGGSFRFILQKFYYEPMFKTKCVSCGRNLRIEIRMPHISSNLKLKIGDDVVLNGVNLFDSASVMENPKLSIGDATNIGFQVTISTAKQITIGSNCLIAARALIMDNNNHPLAAAKRKDLAKVPESEIAPVIIEDNVWIGYQAFIGKGVRVGENSIIGANSVVNKDVPPNTTVLGNPARVVGFLKDSVNDE